MAQTFTAQYPGHCAAQCGNTIEPGDRLTWLVEPSGGRAGEVAHADCIEPDEELLSPQTRKPAPQPKYCPHCFLALPVSGTCDCQD